VVNYNIFNENVKKLINYFFLKNENFFFFQNSSKFFQILPTTKPPEQQNL